MYSKLSATAYFFVGHFGKSTCSEAPWVLYAKTLTVILVRCFFELFLTHQRTRIFPCPLLCFRIDHRPNWMSEGNSPLKSVVRFSNSQTHWISHLIAWLHSQYISWPLHLTLIWSLPIIPNSLPYPHGITVGQFPSSLYFPLSHC